MNIAILADIHDNLPNLEKFLGFAKKEKVKSLIVCGDTGNEETLRFLTCNFKGEIYLVRGNLDQKIEAPDFKILEIDKIKIAFTHFPAEARKLAETKKLDFVFYGHTHKPWLEQIGRCILANPGNLAGMIYKASFAILDTKAKYLSLKILDSL